MTMIGSFGMGGLQSVFSVLFALGFLVFLGIFLAVSIRILGQWNKNNRSPRLTVGALVTAKRTNVSRHSGAWRAWFWTSPETCPGPSWSVTTRIMNRSSI